MSTFGYTSVGGTTNNNWANYMIGGRWQAPADAGTLTKLTARLSNQATSHVACAVKGVIYSDTTGPAPSAVLKTGDEIAIADNAAAAWVDLTVPSTLALTPNTWYWLMLIGNANCVGLTVYENRTGASSTEAQRARTYTLGPIDPWDAGDFYSRDLSIYATYTPASSGIGKFAWWLNAFKWHSDWEPRPDRLIVPKRGGLWLPEPTF